MATNPQLVMRSGPNPGKTFSLTKTEMYIGRDISNDIVINDAEVSRKHVRLLLQAEQYVVEDLGSTNGTFINGQRIAGAHVLAAGETIQMGENVVLVFEAAMFDPDSTAVMSPRDAAELDAAAVAEPEPMMAMDPEPEPMMEMEPEPMMEPEPEPEPEPMMEMEPEPLTPMSTMAEAPAPPPMMSEPPPSDTYTGPAMPAAPSMPAAQEPPKKNSRRNLIAGCGCLLILLCVVIGGALYYIDSANLWSSFGF